MSAAEMDATMAAQLRAPFAPEQIGKLPRISCRDCRGRNANCSNHRKQQCQVCGGYLSTAHIHLDYVGHAAVTDRLLTVDPWWSWEPVAFTDDGLPAFDKTGGLWIRLTVLGVTRLGYGHAAAKPTADPGSREKEVIGDALRNAAMRFGAALDLWHKGDLHADEDNEKEPAQRAKIDDNQWAALVQLIEAKGVDTRAFCEWMKVDSLKDIEACDFFKAKDALGKKPDKAKAVEEELADSIPY